MCTVPDLLWDDVKCLFDPDINGTLPDVVVEGTTVEDWQVLLDLVQSQGWQYAYSLTGEPMELTSAADMVAAASADATPELRVWPIPEVLMSSGCIRLSRLTSTLTSENCKGRSGWMSWWLSSA